jgi:integrase
VRTAPRTFASETDANGWLTLTEAELLRGDWIDPDASRVPLGKYAATWIAPRPRLALRTVVLYEALLRLHIEPILGNLDLSAVTPGRVRSWRSSLLAGGVGQVTVAKTYRLLRAVMNTAVDDELIRRKRAGPKGGTLRRPNFQEPRVAATKAAEVPTLRFHDLRQVGNTLASNTGANLRALMARMGHASPQAALVYQHATAERDRAIADALGEMIVASLAAGGQVEDDDQGDEDK